jgi:membrane associated rhomboid family serine protease
VFGILLWFFLQLYSGTLALANPLAGGGVAWWAHVGGFVAGLVLVAFFTPPRRRTPRVVYEVWDPVRRRWRSL